MTTFLAGLVGYLWCMGGFFLWHKYMHDERDPSMWSYLVIVATWPVICAVAFCFIAYDAYSSEEESK